MRIKQLRRARAYLGDGTQGDFHGLAGLGARAAARDRRRRVRRGLRVARLEPAAATAAHAIRPYAPHIAFVRHLTGLTWPALPDAVMYVAAGMTITSLLLAMVFRLSDPVLRRISRADDHVSWALTLLPLLTGMAVVGEPSSALLGHATPYRDPLAVHLLAVELLLVWFPFGKLMHAVLALPARMQLATFFGRRGVRA